MIQSRKTWWSWCANGLLSLWLLHGLAVHAGDLDCGVLQNWHDFGPFDYRDPFNLLATGADPMGRLKRVENSHFQAELRALNQERISEETHAANFAHTLRVFPNHPESLHLMSRLEGLSGGKLPQAEVTPFTPTISADCFFDRAIRFRPPGSTGRLHVCYSSS